MNIEEILETIDDMLEHAWSLPLTGGRCVVDAMKVRDLIEEIRLNLPAEIKMAREIVSDRNEILNEAKREGEATVRKAEERAKALVDNDSIVRQANAKGMAMLSEASQKASDMVAQATARSNELTAQSTAKATEMLTQATLRAKEMKQTAFDFSEGMLRSTEETVARALTEIKTTRQAILQSAREAIKQQGGPTQGGGPAGGGYR